MVTIMMSTKNSKDDKIKLVKPKSCRKSPKTFQSIFQYTSL